MDTNRYDSRRRRAASFVAAAVGLGLLASAPTAISTTALSAAAPEERSNGVRATLQADADALLRQGAPGVLAELQTDRRELKVRSGVGNRTTRTPVPWNARFRIASMTKPFVATTVLQLVGEDRLSLDDSIDRWLPGLVRGRGAGAAIDGREITVRQLLQHTSGLPEYLTGVPWVFTEKGFRKHRFDTLTARDAVRLAMRMKPTFEPGTSWSYSNTGYALAGLLIEAVTGRSWQREVRDRIVRPLRLRHTTLPDTRTGIPGPNARGYERFPGADATRTDPKYGAFIDATRLNPSFGGAAGEIISTTDDTTRFLRALVRGRLLKPEQLREMQKTVATSEDFRTAWPGARYGLGLMWVPNRCGGSWSHGGDIMGFMTRNGVTPDGRRAVVVSVNTDSFKPDPGVVRPDRDLAYDLVEHALCGR